MAIARATNWSGNLNKNDSYTAGGNMVAATFVYDGSAGDLGTPTYGGVTMVLKKREGGFGRQTEIWAITSSSPTGSNVLTWSGSPTDTLAAMVSYSDYNADDTTGAGAYNGGLQEATLNLGSGAWFIGCVFDNGGTISGNTNIVKFVDGDFGVSAGLDSNTAFTGSTYIAVNVGSAFSFLGLWSFVPAGGGGGRITNAQLRMGVGRNKSFSKEDLWREQVRNAPLIARKAA